MKIAASRPNSTWARPRRPQIDRDPAIANEQWRRIIAERAPLAPAALQVVAARLMACRAVRWHALHVVADATREAAELMRSKSRVDTAQHCTILAALLEQESERRVPR